MISKVARSFWKELTALPKATRRLAFKNYQLWLENPEHPSLRFKKFRHGQWSVRVGDHYRAVDFFRDAKTFVWTWIGSHEDYNKL